MRVKYILVVLSVVNAFVCLFGLFVYSLQGTQRECEDGVWLLTTNNVRKPK